jgi:hypothetical protein
MSQAGRPGRRWRLLHDFWRGGRRVCGCARCPGLAWSAGYGIDPGSLGDKLGGLGKLL